MLIQQTAYIQIIIVKKYFFINIVFYKSLLNFLSNLSTKVHGIFQLQC
jgi:hypothetical protein